MSAPRKTSKRALPNVPGAAMVQALGDAVFGKGNAVVEQTYPVTFAGRPVTVSLSVEEVVRYLTATGWEEHGSDVAIRIFFQGSSHCAIGLGMPGLSDFFSAAPIAKSLQCALASIATAEDRHPLDVVDAILAARHGTAHPADPVTAAILHLFRVAPDKGIAEDEVVRHLLASGLDVDSDDVGDRLVKMAMGDNAALDMVHRGGPDRRPRGPIMYARGPAVPAAS